MEPVLRRRESILERGETEWRAGADALVVMRPDGTRAELPWKDVVELRLIYAATALKPWRWKVVLSGRSGVALAFDNGHFVEAGVFEPRTAAFVRLVNEAVDRTEARSPGARFSLGTPPALYAAQLASLLAAVVLLQWVMVLVPATHWAGTVWARLLSIAVLVLPALNWAVASWPRRASPEDVRTVLDQAASSASA